jgi:23S rRNA (uracil1939-C5)-methyltransferase
MICRHFGDCGGCSLQDVPYAEQLARKHRILDGQLTRAAGRRLPAVDPVTGMDVSGDAGPWAFRHKVTFAFGQGPRGRGLVMGHYARESNRLIPVDECPVHSARGNRIAFALRDALVRANVPAAGPRLDGLVRHVIVRTTADERQAVAMLVVTHNDKRLRTPVRAVMAGPDAPDGFVVNVHDRPGPFMVGRESLVVAGRGQVRETAFGTAFLISPTAFFQTNVRAAGVLLDTVLTAIPASPPRRVLDLYSGSGLFGLPLAARGHTVTMVEENPQAMKDAAENIRTNRLVASRIRLICERAEDALTPSRHRGPAIGDIDVAVVDPPRDGCPPAVTEALFTRLRPPRVFYVSCNPDALARELPAILEAGYRVERILPVDMFPHTEHVEVIVELARG